MADQKVVFATEPPANGSGKEIICETLKIFIGTTELVKKIIFLYKRSSHTVNQLVELKQIKNLKYS